MRKHCDTCKGAGFISNYRVGDFGDGEFVVKDFIDCPNPNCVRGVVYIPLEAALNDLAELIDEFENTCPHPDTQVVISAYKEEIHRWISKVQMMLKM